MMKKYDFLLWNSDVWIPECHPPSLPSVTPPPSMQLLLLMKKYDFVLWNSNGASLASEEEMRA